MMTVRRSKQWTVINFQKLCSLFSKACQYVALFQEFVDTPVNGRPSLFLIESVRQIVFSFPHFVSLLILSLWLRRCSDRNDDCLNVKKYIYFVYIVSENFAVSVSLEESRYLSRLVSIPYILYFSNFVIVFKLLLCLSPLILCWY
jgi:hypothetical protein